METGFKLEETYYKGLYSRDVNNYLAIKENGFKGKGIFARSELEKNPEMEISNQAVVNYLAFNTPLEKTIRECKDIRKFIQVRSVTGGAFWRNKYLGKVVRWIYSTNGFPITYKKNGNKVPDSNGSRPIMELEKFPKDIDFFKYEEKAKDILEDLGIKQYF